MSFQKYSYSIYEHAWEASDRVRGCKFLLPTSFTDQIGRFLHSANQPREDLTWGKFTQLTEYLTRKGILTSLAANGPQRHDLPPVYDVRATHTKHIYGYGIEHRKMRGSAYAIAIGELLERYFISDKKLDRESMKDVILQKNYPKIPLKHFNTFLEEQLIAFPNLRQIDEGAYDYTVCTQISTGNKVRLPSQFCYLRAPSSTEPPLVQSSSNGAGAYYNREEAILSGLYELVQRDNFMLMWLTKEVRPQIDIGSLPMESSIAWLVKQVTSRGVDVYFVDMAREIPVLSFTCIVVDRRNDTPIVGVGGASGGDLETCLYASLTEALALLNKNMSKDTFINFATYKPFATMGINRDERLTMWKGERIKHLDFLLVGKKVAFTEYVKGNLTFESKQKELDHLVKILEEKGSGYEVYVREIRSRILSALGYHVVKVVVPALMPLYLEETLATLSSERLAQALHIKMGDIRLSMINPYPHPFP